MHDISNNQHQQWYQRTYCIRRYQNCNFSQILIFGGYVKVRESLYTQVMLWVNTILDHVGTIVVLPRHGSSCIAYRPEWYWKHKNIIKYSCHACNKICEILIIDTQTILKLIGKTILVQHWFKLQWRSAPIGQYFILKTKLFDVTVGTVDKMIKDSETIGQVPCPRVWGCPRKLTYGEIH
jgi:hypothetical protein